MEKQNVDTVMKPGHLAETYARRVFRRFREPMELDGYSTDWIDQPSKHKFYPGAPTLPLPPPFQTRLQSLGAAIDSLASQHLEPPSDISLEVLSTMLNAYAINGRRIRLNWSDDNQWRLAPSDAVWGRGTASGGGLYPGETYLVVGRGSPLLPGVYHYNTAYHYLTRISTGDVTDEVRLAVADPHIDSANCFVAVTARFWKNAFKYNNFCFHVVTQDVGALLGSWRLLLAASGVSPYACLWFDEQAVDGLLEVDTLTESSFAVLGFRWQGREATVPAVPAIVNGAIGSPTYRTRPLSWERSRVVHRFPDVEAMHRAALVGAAVRPPTRPEPTPAIPPSSTRLVDGDLADCLRRRQSSFGLFTAEPPLRNAQLRGVLWACSRASLSATDVKAGLPGRRWTGLWVFANSVTDVRPGAYRYDESSGQLVGVNEFEVGPFLQKYYALRNYNMREVGAALVITGFLGEALETYGDRGYRMLQIEVGAVCQTAYLVATAQRIGCGAVLGIDNVAVDEVLGIEGSGENSLLFVLLGNERPGATNFRHEIATPSRMGREETC
jgi:SagB-type dehydrogenase family enzyme